MVRIVIGMIGGREKDYCKEVAQIVYNIDVSNKNTSFNSDSTCNGGHNNSYIIMVVAVTIVKPSFKSTLHCSNYSAIIVSTTWWIHTNIQKEKTF
jgi:hypothetical protein